MKKFTEYYKINEEVEVAIGKSFLDSFREKFPTIEISDETANQTQDWIERFNSALDKDATLNQYKDYLLSDEFASLNVTNEELEAVDESKKVRITGGHKDYIDKEGTFIKDYQLGSIIVDVKGKKVVVQKGDFEFVNESTTNTNTKGVKVKLNKLNKTGTFYFEKNDQCYIKFEDGSDGMFDKNDFTIIKENEEVVENESINESSKFDSKNIGIGFLGNGNVVWDRTIEDHGDYKQVAFAKGKPNQNIEPGEAIRIYLKGPDKSYNSKLMKYLETVYSKNEITFVNTYSELMSESENVEDTNESSKFEVGDEINFSHEYAGKSKLKHKAEILSISGKNLKVKVLSGMMKGKETDITTDMICEEENHKILKFSEYSNINESNVSIRFHENDYKKLVSDVSADYPFYSIKNGDEWTIKKEKNDKKVATWKIDDAVLIYTKDSDLISWLKHNSYL